VSDLDVTAVSALYLDLHRARAFDRLMLRAARRGRIKGYYPSAGQEGLAAVAGALTRDDMVFPAYREQPLRLAMGITVAEEVAMWAGAARAAWNPLERRCMPANTAIGSHLPHAVGWARAQRMLGDPGIAVAVFGDGATSEGDFHAALNLAGVWSAPVVFVCQNNQYAQTMAWSAQTAAAGLASKADAYGVRGVQVDGMDALAVRAAFAEAAARARSGDGATLLELTMYRFSGHSSFEVAPTYRTRAEEAMWRERDPVGRLRDHLEGLGADVARLTAQAEHGLADEIDAALAALAEQTVPSHDELDAWVHSATTDASPSRFESFRESTLVAATNAALHDAMVADDHVIVMGEDVAIDGGIWGVTEGLANAFGAERVIDTPLNEQGLVGAAIGMALAGLRPVVEIQFGGFLLTAFDQIAFHAARYAWRTQGVCRIPLVIRMPAGGGHGGYEGHNDAYEALLAHTPGLAVSAPSNPADAYAVMRRAVASDGPHIVLEPTASYLATRWPADATGRSLAAPDASPRPAPAATQWQRGDACTVVTYGSATSVVVAAAELLSDGGIEVDLIDLVDIAPWDRSTVQASVERTGRLVVVHDSPRTAGFGAEVVSSIVETVPLVSPPVRVAQPDLPYGPALLSPSTELSADQVVDAVRRVVRG
jgi:2-oxoisovalerate dehydrogenase E1 component